MTKEINKREQGKINKRKGKAFEKSVQNDLEKQGWIVAKWTKRVESGKLVNIKPKFNPYTHSVMYTGTGFPDFIAIKQFGLLAESYRILYEIVFIECKGGMKYNNQLDEAERLQADWMKQHGQKILIATKGEKRGTIKYTDYEPK